ncbi:hypothetical protein BDB00DRAFT_844483 [Zychaea mexicana]|uniref:uncharacterized protein n=1 Tax=Zychaea mexicana TaxID=64656 RepID=UPI0022FE4042|nr:uncharacterized protein BDB00DRAFT_844483 [Zychaea mexicana]KAI9489240.1 hypothetical protein BDB00DRAFT_844483 [Zychaea mexicana]
MSEDTPDPANARTSTMVKTEEVDSDDDDVPLSMRSSNNAKRSATAVVKAESDEDDDNIPLSRKRKKLFLKKVKKENGSPAPAPVAATLKRSRAPISDDEEDAKPLAKRGKVKVKAEPTTASSSSSSSAKKAKVKKEEKKKEDEDIYKWWEASSSAGGDKDEEADGSIKWTTLQHNGVLFPPVYEPHGVKMKYDGKPITLSPEAEEVASFFAALLESDHAKNPTFQKNFFRDWQDVLKKEPRNPKITSFDRCDFRPIWEKFEKDREKKKQMTKEEKLKIKEEKNKIEEQFLYAYVDGRKEKVGNFRIEPPGLFRGRGDHPKTGTLKQRVAPEQVTLNLSEDAKIPKPPAGHKWADVVHDQTATWLATWKENVNGTIKYVFLAQSSAWKGQSDMQKFDKARELKKYVKQIRKDYTKELHDKEMAKRQRATAMYLIDRLALRAGNEKGDDEADTVGCCSLRYEHIQLEAPNTLHFDFLGKDSIRYQNSVQVETQVFKNIKLFKKQVGPGSMIFDRLSTTGLNKHLNSCMPGLSAKVFRTYNASHTFQQQLDKLTRKEDTLPDKMLSFNRANRDVAVLCNHQRSASKSHGQMMERLGDRTRALKYQRMKLRHMLFALEPSYKKKSEYNEPESDMDDEWIAKHETELMAKEREKAKTKFEKQNEKLKAEGEKELPASHLKESLKAVNELEARLAKERKKGVAEPKGKMTAERCITGIEKMDQRIAAMKIQATDKEENKEIALSTSKMNYIDPRISVAWSKKYDVPVQKVFNKTLLEKFRWAQEVTAKWIF